MKTGFLFAGQGQQFLFMGQDLSDAYPQARLMYERATSILGYDVRTLDEVKLQTTRYTQPALYVLGHVLDVLLKGNGITPEVVCGLSLGEYNALTSAHALEFEEGLALIQTRARLMQDAFEPYTTTMVACLKTNQDKVEAVIKGSDVEICNINTHSQIVIGGHKDAVDAIMPELKNAKIRAIPLKVSTVSHMSLLKPVSEALRTHLESCSYTCPSIPFINNIKGELQSEGFVDTLARHISEPTLLAQSIQTMRDLGVEHFIEVGPKGALSNCVKELCGDRVKRSNVYNLETLRSVIA